MPIYPKPVRELMHDMVAELKLTPGQVFQRDDVLDWFESRYPLVKEGTVRAHLMRMSVNAPSRVHHRLRKDDDLFFQIDASRFRLYEKDHDPAPITREGGGEGGTGGRPEPDDEPVGGTSAEDSQFAYEHDLRDYLARHLELIEPGLRLYDDEGITGIEFPAGGRFIDILAVDREGGYVVVELKVSKGYDRVIGQLLRYIGWIEKHQAEVGQRVRGVIVAKNITEDLRLACGRIQGVRLFEYALSVTLTPVGA